MLSRRPEEGLVRGQGRICSKLIPSPSHAFPLSLRVSSLYDLQYRQGMGAHDIDEPGNALGRNLILESGNFE